MYKQNIKAFTYNILLTLLISGVIILNDIIFSKYNTYFEFEFSSKEYFRIFITIFFISFLKAKNTIKILLSFIFLASLFQFAYFQYFGKNINGIDFYLFFTHIEETFETFNTILPSMIVPLFISSIAFIISIFIVNIFFEKKKYFKYGYTLILLALIFLTTQTFYITNIKKGKLRNKESKLIYPMSKRVSSRNFFVSFNYFVSGILPNKIFHLKKSDFPKQNTPILINKNIHRDIYLIIGESLRYKNFKLNSIYTPNLSTLQNNNDFFYFNKIYSGGTMTKVSVSTLINRLKYPSSLEQIAKEDNCLFKLAKQNNINTYFLSAQNAKHLQILKNMMCPQYINIFKKKEDFEKTGYDEDLISLIKTFKLNNNSNLYVMQQRGSHSPYKKQYPKIFDKNSTPYENSAIYTDYVLFNLVKEIKKRSNKEFIIIFTSDHGELLGENGKKGHGFLKQEVYEVPYFAYSNTKDTKIQEELKSIKIHFDISNLITTLLGYKVDKDDKNNRKLYIMNSDLEGFSGYATIKIQNGKEEKIKKFKN